VLLDAPGAFLASFHIDILESLGPGFWLALVICLFQVLQLFAARPQVSAKVSSTGEVGRTRPTTRGERILDLAYTFPWWAAVMVIIGVYVSISIAGDPIYDNIYTQLRAGVSLTLRVTFSAYAGGLLIGLIIGVIRSYPPRPNAAVIGLISTNASDHAPGAIGLPLALLRSLFSVVHLLVYNASTFFVEVMRGLPILIVLLVSAFIIVPDVRNTLNDTFGWDLQIRGSSVTTAIVALALAYGAYISEIFRAGVQSIERGQVEAARSLGMNSRQTLRFVILPQAFRRVLPPLGNDFIAMVKDSSLVTILGLRDVTQIAKVSSGSSFRYLETYLTVAVIYLMMTILGSLCIRVLEQYLRQQER
jgi:ABC-type amino acid transport system permease subunit